MEEEMVAAICDTCKEQYLMTKKLANSNATGHYCSEECWVEHIPADHNS